MEYPSTAIANTNRIANQTTSTTINLPITNQLHPFQKLPSPKQQQMTQQQQQFALIDRELQELPIINNNLNNINNNNNNINNNHKNIDTDNNNNNYNNGQNYLLVRPPQHQTKVHMNIKPTTNYEHSPKLQSVMMGEQLTGSGSGSGGFSTDQMSIYETNCECDPTYQVANIDGAGGRSIALRQTLTPLVYSDCRVQCLLQGQQEQQTEAEQLSAMDIQNMAMTPSETITTPIRTPSNGSLQPPTIPPTSSTTSSSLGNIGGVGGSSLPSLSSQGGQSPNGAGKINPPLEVSFILYTRHHRDLAYKFAINQLTNKSGSSGTVAATVKTAPESITSLASTQLMMGGELIDLTNETKNPTGSGGNFATNPTIGYLPSQHSLIGLNSSLPIKMIIHGFGSGARRPWVVDMVYKLLEFEDVIVIVVDWEKGATMPNYVQAAGNTRIVGHEIANFIRMANIKYGFTGQQYHLIGFSLGAHVAGFAGMECNSTQIGPRIVIQRITGLDPASPLFEGYEANDRLDPTDAKFVDVIHSNGDGVLRGGFGSLQPMGHVDFYPNGGRVQVGCNSVLLSALSDIIYGKWQSLCNHRRALNFFMDSFEYAKCRFRSFKCDSYENYVRGDCFDCGHNNEGCSFMGYRANQSRARGKMYLTTHEDAPFCANQFIIKLIGTKGYKTTWGKIEVTLVTLDGKNESFWLSPSLNRDRDRDRDRDKGRERERERERVPTETSDNNQNPYRDQNQSSSLINSPSPISSSLSPQMSSSGLATSTSPSPMSSSSSLSANVPASLMTTNINNHGSLMINSANNVNSGLSTSETIHQQVFSASGSSSSKDERPGASQMSLQSLIVAHPSLSNFTQVLLRYTRYKGWIYSGDESWSIDKVFIMDSDGQIKSFCGPNTILESHITTRVSLELGNCTVAEQACCSNGSGTNNNNNNPTAIANNNLSTHRGVAQSVILADEAQTGPNDPGASLANIATRSQTQAVNQRLGGNQQPNTIQMRVPRLYATMVNHNNNMEATALESQHLPIQFVGGTNLHSFQRFTPLIRDRAPNQQLTNQQQEEDHRQQQHSIIAQQLVAQQQYGLQQLIPNNNNNKNFPYHHPLLSF